MEDLVFFEPSVLLREYTLLKAIFSNGSLSQQKLSKLAKIAPSMVNRYLALFEQKGLIEKIGPNRRKMEYRLTQDGIYRLQYLSVSYLRETARLYSTSRLVFVEVLEQLSKERFRKIVLYGAGIVGQTLLDVLRTEGIDVLCFVDDDPSKHNKSVNGVVVLSSDKVKLLDYDTTLIASFRHAEKIAQRAKSLGMKNIFILMIQTDGKVFLQRRE
ncbi:winged helix-turn-helix transcriptional regulator [Pseudothermotoga sp. U03pept]|uniref:winged helix-turn-helix transcriptional regulator n=1 Tax=Pseudothermotoga sp. U03pept TaxID=3447012 RepID=UPI003F113C74